MMEAVALRRPQWAYVLPVSLEILLFVVSAFIYPISSIFLASTLLFAMGLQNALVTRVSQSVVRTTHLTGLFTDLGIELSQLLFRRERSSLKRDILLKLSIIAGFFLGCLVGGFAYSKWGILTLLIPAGMLLYTLWYDRLRFRYYHLKRKHGQFRRHGVQT